MSSVKTERQISVFISYAHEDTEFAKDLQELLQEEGIKVWIDDHIRPIAEWETEIEKAIVSHDYIIFIASKSSIASENCKKELIFAKNNNKKILPINIDSKLEWLPSEIEEIQWINFSSATFLNSEGLIRIDHHNSEFDQYYSVLVSALETDLDWVSTHSRLLEKAWEWKAANKNKSYLLIGDELQYFKDSITGHKGNEPGLTEDQIDLIKDSEAHEIDQLARRKRLKRFIASLAVMLILIGAIATFFGINDRRKAIENLSISLADKSELMVDNPSLSLLLAINANQIKPSSKTRASLFSAVLRNQYQSFTMKLPGSTMMDLSDDLLVVGYCIEETTDTFQNCPKSEIRFIDLNSYHDLVPPIYVSGFLYELKIKPDKTQVGLLWGTLDAETVTIQVYEIGKDSTNLKLTKELNEYTFEFGINDNQFITGSSGAGDGLIKFWDINTGIYYTDPIDTGGVPVNEMIVDKNDGSLFWIDLFGLNRWDSETKTNEKISKSGAFNPYSIMMLQNDSESFGLTPSANMLSMVISSDSQFVATKGRSEIIIWDVAKKSSVVYLQLDLEEFNPFEPCMNFIPNSPILAYCHNDSIVFFDTETMQAVHSVDQPGITDFQISDDGRFIVLCYSGRDIKVVDIDKGNALVTGEKNIFPDEFLQDLTIGHEEIVAMDGGTLIFLDHNLEEEKRFKMDCDESYALSPDGKLIAFGCKNGEILLKDINSSHDISILEIGDGGPVRKIFFTPDNNYLVCSSDFGKIVKFDVKSNSVVWETVLDSDYQGWTSMTSTMSPDGKYIFLPGIADLYDNLLVRIDDEEPIFSTPSDLIMYAEGMSPITVGAFSPNSRYAAFAITDQRILIYNIAEDSIDQFIPIDGMIAGFSFLDDNTIVFSSTSGEKTISPFTGAEMWEDNSIEIWDIKNRLRIGFIPNAHQSTIHRIIRIDDEQFVSASHDGLIRTWNISDDLLTRTACALAGRDLTEDEWNKFVEGVLPYTSSCENPSYSIQSNGIIDIDYSPAQVLTRFGIPNELEAETFEYDPNVIHENEFIPSIIIENTTDNVSVEEPQIIQCRDKMKTWEYQNYYVIAWPISITQPRSLNFLANYEPELNSPKAYMIDTDGTEKNIKLYGPLTPGKYEVIIPAAHNFSSVVGSENASILKFVVDSIPTLSDEDFGEDRIDEIQIEEVELQAHLNVYAGNINYPMHSMKVTIKNGCCNHITKIRMVAIIYDENDNVIDFLLLSDGFPLFPLQIKENETIIETLISLSETGRCVGYSDPDSPLKIRLWTSFELDVDGETRYHQIYSELDWD